MKRILDCQASDFKKMNAKQLKQAIQAAEGRTIISETIASVNPLIPSVTNPELAKAHGADIILLNLFDVNRPYIAGLENSIQEDANPILAVKNIVGLPIGINLEPVEPDVRSMETLTELPEGRMATEATIKKAVELGVNVICLTGNPKTGVTNSGIIKAIQTVYDNHGSDVLIIAGKMHSAGSASNPDSKIISKVEIEQFAQAGCDVLLLPAPGTVPGTSVEFLQPLVRIAQENGLLTMGSIGTSQEGADVATIRNIALMSKMAGFDMHHIGDAGYQGIAMPENIEAYSITIRGKRHTLARKAASVNR